MAETEKDRNRIKLAKLRKQTVASSGARGHALFVLKELAALSDYDENRVRVSKKTLAGRLNCSRNTIKASLRYLREEGTIVAISHETGGYASPTTYRLQPVGEGSYSRVRRDESGGGGGLLSALRDHFEAKSKYVWERFISHLIFKEISDGTLVLVAPSGFYASQIHTNYSDEIAEVAMRVEPDVKRVRIIT